LKIARSKSVTAITRIPQGNPRPRLKDILAWLKTAAVQLPAPFDERMGAAHFNDGFDLKAHR
jgi:hypothetical protein